MAVERDFDLLDDYIGNRMTAKERTEFEQKLSSDPELARQYDVQKTIVESIRSARAAELKSMLSNIPMTAIPTSSALVTKIIGAAATIALVSTAVYFYFDKSGDPKTRPEQAIVADSASNQPVVSQEQLVEKDASPATNTPEAKERLRRRDATVEKADPKEPTIDVFDPSEEETTSAKAPVDIEVTKNSKVVLSNIPYEIVAVDDSNRRYTFHYQFKNGRLYLYGSFEKNVYEILDFISEDKRTAFLFYKNNYYLLNSSNQKIKSLVPVNDPVLLQKLREYRSAR